MANGIVGMKPRDMLRLTAPYSRIAYAPEQIESMSCQKADIFTGVLFILIAFLIQVVGIILIPNEVKFGNTKWVAVLLVLIVTLILIFIGYWVRKSVRLHNKSAIGKLALRDYCERRFSGTIDPVNAESFVEMSEEILCIVKERDETTVDFIKRMAEHINWKIPDEANFSKITKNQSGR
jgi:hypothetical protein